MHKIHAEESSTREPRAHMGRVVCAVCLAGLVLGLASCIDVKTGKSTLTVLFTAGSSDSKMGPIDVETIESLEVTITKIVLDHSGEGGECTSVAVVDVSEDGFEPTTVTVDVGGAVQWIWTADVEHSVTSGVSGDGSAGADFDETRSVTGEMFEHVFAEVGFFPYFSRNDESAVGAVEVVEASAECTEAKGVGVGQIVVFEGEERIDLMQLTELSTVLASVEIPSGTYTKIRLHIQDPEMVLTDETVFVSEDFQLTANGRLFISKTFELPDGQTSLLTLDFGGIHVVESGNSGKVVLTPQLRADITIEARDVTITGQITVVDGTLITVLSSLLEFLVDVSTATVSDSDGTALTTADLVVGQFVQVTALLQPEGPVVADSVLIIIPDAIP